MNYRINILTRCGDSRLQSQHFDGPRQEDRLSPGVKDQPGKHTATPFVQKNLKLARHGGSRLSSQHFGMLRQVDHKIRNLRPAWPTQWKPISTKITKISWAWWQAPVIPATQEAEVPESLETRRQGFQWAEIEPLHSSMGDRAREKKEKEKKTDQVERPRS